MVLSSAHSLKSETQELFFSLIMFSTLPLHNSSGSLINSFFSNIHHSCPFYAFLCPGLSHHGQKYCNGHLSFSLLPTMILMLQSSFKIQLISVIPSMTSPGFTRIPFLTELRKYSHSSFSIFSDSHEKTYKATNNLKTTDGHSRKRKLHHYIEKF